MPSSPNNTSTVIINTKIVMSETNKVENPSDSSIIILKLRIINVIINSYIKISQRCVKNVPNLNQPFMASTVTLQVRYCKKEMTIQTVFTVYHRLTSVETQNQLNFLTNLYVYVFVQSDLVTDPSHDQNTNAYNCSLFPNVGNIYSYQHIVSSCVGHKSATDTTTSLAMLDIRSLTAIRLLNPSWAMQEFHNCDSLNIFRFDQKWVRYIQPRF